MKQPLSIIKNLPDSGRRKENFMKLDFNCVYDVMSALEELLQFDEKEWKIVPIGTKEILA